MGGQPQGTAALYRHNAQTITSDVDTPANIGLGGRQNMKFLFDSGHGIIYAVPQ